jgi:hypothetical protein
MFNSSNKTYGSSNVFSNSFKETNNQGNNSHSNSQNNSNFLNNSAGYNKPREGQPAGNSNNPSNPFNQAMSARANGHNLSSQSTIKSN